MQRRLEGKVSIITGSTSGLGAAMAERFAREGARIVVSGRSAERGARVVEAIEEQGGEACFLACDLGDEDAIARLVARTLERYGRLDNLVANAATTATSGGEKTASILELDNALLETSIATNIRGLLWLFKHALPALVAAARPEERRTSSIIAIGTSGTRNGTPRMPIYFSTKAPVEVLVRSLASEFGGRGVRVNCVSAGLIETESEMRTMTEEFRRYVMSLNRLPFFGVPEDIASACAYLASDEAAYVTGTTLCVNGGVSF
jgi:NAD(P)-dependent dehydrogenase (short-subunit alcohol dehydrogenase family)